MSEALNEGQEEFDVNSDAGFAQALARAVGTEVSEEQIQHLDNNDTSVQHNLVTEEESAPSQARDEQGRFAPAALPDEEEEGVAPQVEEEDPREREFREAQSLIGRQGNELGELRRQIEELRQTQSQPEAAQQAPPAPAPFVDQETVDQLYGAIEKSGGPQIMQWVVSQRPDLFDAALETWADISPAQAAGWNARYQTWLAHEQIKVQGQGSAQPAAPADPYVQRIVQREQAGELVEALKGEVGAQKWALIKDHLPTVYGNEGNVALRNLIANPDRETAMHGLRLAAQVAEAEAIKAKTAEVTQQRQQESTQAKQAARVASGSLRPAQKRQPEAGEDDSEARKQAFRDALLAAPSTSVLDNITVG